MIIWGTRTKREGVGFVVAPCAICQTERIHFVAQSKTKFTLYFVPTFTTSTKALLVCTECERTVEVDGARGQQLLQEAVPREVMLRRLQGRAAGSHSPEPPAMPAELSFAVALVAVAMTAAGADGEIEDSEAAAVVQAVQTIAESTQSETVRASTAIAATQFGQLIDYVASPATEPIPLMLARAGSAARDLPKTDQYRLIGQLSWLCHTIATASHGPSDAVLGAMDGAIAAMGFSAREVADALGYCEANGG